MREVFPFVTLVFLILTTLILTQQLGRQTEIVLLPASLSLTLKALLYLLPSVAIVTLPFALLIGIIVGLNRLSADSEITAAKSSGLGILRLTTPLLILGLAATFISLLLTHYAVPWAARQLKLTRERLIRETLGQNIKPHTFSNYFPNYLIYIQEIEPISGHWIGVFILKKDAAQNTRLFTASRGEIRITETSFPSIEIQLSQGLSLETFSNNANQNLASFTKLTLKLSNLGQAATSQSANSQTSVQEATTQQLSDRMADRSLPKEAIQAAIEYHKRFALPFASLALVIVGIVAGTQTARYSGRAGGLALGFLVALAYYLILIAGQNLAVSGTLSPFAGVWLANVICLVSTIILARSNRPFTRRHRTIHTQVSSDLPVFTLSKPGRTSNLSYFTNLINYILISELAKYFIISLAALVLISIIFTLFDLIPAMVRNNISVQYTIGYLSHLTPQITYYVAPFALLVSILTTYNILSRTNQITAMLAGGQGHFALSIPSLSAVALLMILLFVLSESVLPQTNREQDYRYHYIKGRRIEQAAVAFGQKWVYGLNHTIYSYQYLEHDNRLLNTTAYSLDPSQYLLREITFAHEASQTNPTNSLVWNVSDGYRYTVRDHQLTMISSTLSSPLTLNIPEGAAIFRRTTNAASKMKLGELQSYIQHLTLIGAPTTDLRIELEKKKAFPFTCLTLAALALPFALANTRRSTFAGFGFSIGFSLAFWSVTTLLEAAGKRSLLPVWMAAWGAQVLFSTLAAYLFSKRKF